jgi:hypothetical protein
MRMTTLHTVLAGLMLGLSACATQDDIASSTAPIMNPNIMNPNALNPNVMNPNALRPGALTPNALDPDSVDGQSMQSLKDPGDAGDLSREFMKYAVSCAFSPGQTFDFTWKDSDGNVNHTSYPGLLGLAPYWQTGPLDVTGQQWVSACMASRVNALGVSVMLSSRGLSPALATTASERSYYATREAAWFGNIFGWEGQVYTCYDVVNSSFAQLEDRVCGSNGSITSLLLNGLQTYNCGAITVIGPCLNVIGLLSIGPCSYQNWSEGYFYGCDSPFWLPYNSITTFIHGPVPL